MFCTILENYAALIVDGGGARCTNTELCRVTVGQASLDQFLLGNIDSAQLNRKNGGVLGIFIVFPLSRRRLKVWSMFLLYRRH